MKFFIVGNRDVERNQNGQRFWMLLSTQSFPTLEEAQALAAKIPKAMNPTIVNTTNQGEKA